MFIREIERHFNKEKNPETYIIHAQRSEGSYNNTDTIFWKTDRSVDGDFVANLDTYLFGSRLDLQPKLAG